MILDNSLKNRRKKTTVFGGKYKNGFQKESVFSDQNFLAKLFLLFIISLMTGCALEVTAQLNT